MKSEDKTREQLFADLAELRNRVGELEQADAVRRQVVEDLRQSKQRLSLHFYQTPLGAIEWDLDFRVARWNPGAERIFGYSEEEALGHHASFIVPHEFREHIDHIWNDLVARQGGQRSTNNNITKDGRAVLCEWYNTPLVDVEGNVIGVASLVDDITERKHAEKVLQQQTRELAAINRLGQLVNAHLSLDQFGEAAIRGIVDAIGPDIVVLFRRNDDTLSLQSCGPEDSTFFHDHLPIHRVGDCLCGLAVSERRAVYSADMGSDPRCTGEECKQAGLQSFAALPLRMGEEIIGVLGLGAVAQRDFQEQSSFLETMANDIAMCFHNAILYEQLQLHAVQLEGRVEERTAELRASNERLQRKIEERRQTQATLDAFFSESTAILNIVDEDFRYIKTDGLTPTYFGLDSQTIVGKSVKDLAPQFVEAFGPMMQRVIETAEPVHNVEVHTPLLARPGEIAYWRASYFPISLPECKRGCGVVAVEITDMKRTHEALLRERRTLKHMLQASDHERQLIAYDIHDGLAQQLAGAVMQFEVFDHHKETTPKRADDAFRAGMTMLRQGHFEARRLISGVRPPILDESGVVTAIAHLVHEKTITGGPRIAFHSKVNFTRLSPVLENSVYRIVQEAVTNACKHSKSEEIRISLVQKGDRVQVEIKDWGVGFNPKVVQENRYGLPGIRERARVLGGKCRIKSKHGEGTTVVVQLPVVARDEAE